MIRKRPILTVSKHIDGAVAVWFAASRSFTLLEQPAWDVLNAYKVGRSKKLIASELAQNYGVPVDEAQIFATDIIAGINQLNNPENVPYRALDVKPEYHSYTFETYSEHYYLVSDCVLRFHYGNSQIEHIFHPAMAHLEVPACKADHLLEIFEADNLFIFRCDSEVTEAFEKENSHYLRGAVSQKLIGLAHGIGDQSWMITLHSAAVSDGHKALVFPAQAGSGKSTLSALLQAEGYTILSDDFNAINRENGMVYRLPMAISIKSGSIEVLKHHYPELSDRSTELAYTGKEVRYLPLPNTEDPHLQAFPVTAFVFIKYGAGLPFLFEPIDKKEAIQRMLPETWVNPNPSNVEHFFNWLDTVSFYQLQYSQNKEALSAISSLYSDTSDQ